MVHILRRRRRLIQIITGSCIVGAMLFCVFSTRRYQASGSVQIQKESSAGLGLEAALGGGTSDASDALGANINLQTQADILQSSTLALQVISKLHLDEQRDFTRRGPLSRVMGLFSFGGRPDTQGASLEDSPRRRDGVLGIFRSNLSVKAVTGTRIIQVDYQNSDPKVAADVVNALIDALKEYTFSTRYTATNETSSWLEGQLNDLRKQVEDSQARVVELEKNRGLFSLGEDSQGRAEVYSTTLDRLQHSTSALSEAELNRILKGAIYNTVKDGDAEMISGLSGNTLGNTSPALNDSLTLLHGLRQQEATLQGQLAVDQTKYGEEYPKLKQDKNQLNAVQTAIRQEVGRIKKRAETDYQVAEEDETATRSMFDRNRDESNLLNDRNIEYTVAKQEATQSRELYTDLLRRLKEAGILEGLKASNVMEVDKALVPSRATKPNIIVVMGGGIGLGLFLGLCGALFVDLIDNSVQTSDDIERQAGLPLFGLLPYFSAGGTKKQTLPEVIEHPDSPYSEALRSVSSALMLSRGGHHPQVVFVTSAVPGEGKSTFAANFAVSMARTGKRVLLVEADMRRPSLRKYLGRSSALGLSQLLADDTQTVEFQRLPDVPLLDILPVGVLPPLPAELLGSERLKQLLQDWRRTYALIVFDSPPTLPVADTSLIVHLADIVVVMARTGLTTRPSLQRTDKILRQHMGDSPLGVVLNGVKSDSDAYATYYGYSYRREYNYYSKARSEDDGADRP
jgi:capsular exopolysaccharide synthesis family protein